MYAIIATGGKQYKVSEGDVIRVEKLDVEAGNTVTFDQVIAVSDNGLKVGEAVANATVSGTVMDQGRGRKVIVYKYKRKLCCNNFLTEFDSVSINMAKNQNLSLNPTKINGVCGRLLCCLNYEDEEV